MQDLFSLKTKDDLENLKSIQECLRIKKSIYETLINVRPSNLFYEFSIYQVNLFVLKFSFLLEKNFQLSVFWNV